MKDWMHPILAAVIGGVVGAGAARWVHGETNAGRAAGPEVERSALQSEITQLRAEQAALMQRLEALPLPASSATPATRVAVQDIDRAVAEYMASQGSPGARGASGTNEERAGEDALMADRILSGQWSYEEVQAIWKELRDTGRIDAVLAEIERQAALEPGNPDLQNELGKAYLQKLFDSGIGPTAMAWGEKADDAFDQALAVDDQHWEARFQKAISLSNWPAFMGKQAESMRQFETLMEQQEASGTLHSGYEVTYLFLGNLYNQAGDHAKARATWERGAARFPANQTLASKLED